MVDLKPYLLARFGSRLEKHGVRVGIPCPECDTGRKSDFRLWWNTQKGVGTCYKCGVGFDALKLVRALDGLSLLEGLRVLADYTQTRSLSLSALSRKTHQFFEEGIPTEKEVPLVEMPLPREFIQADNWHAWPPYLMKRIGSKKIIESYGIGWCPSGYYGNRMVIPVVQNGLCVSFVARDMTGKAEKKVLYPKGSHTSRMLFNYDRAKEFSQVILVEGVLDALRVGPRAVALFGTTLSSAQYALLAASQATEVVLMLDGDDAGRAGAQKLRSRLRGAFALREVRLPRGDPDDYLREVLQVMARQASLVGQGALAGHVHARLRG